jgi:HAD superfamily hydrolase (TIGR01509 family)
LTRQKKYPHIAAGLCDLDGTLIESERVLHAAWTELTARAGADFSTFDYADLIGKPDLDCCAVVARHFNLDRDPVLWFEEFKKIVFANMDRDLELRPGVHEFLEIAAHVKMPLALVTSATMDHARKALDKFALFDAFGVHVTADTAGLAARKPDPAPYLLAAHLLGVDPRRCVAFEDSPSGVASARAAGCYVCAIPHRLSPASGLASAHAILDSLADFDPNNVRFA